MKGNRIKLLREEKGLRQDELSKILDVSPSAIGMYERDEREPNDDITLKLAEFFNVTTDYLLGKSDNRNSDCDKELLKIELSAKEYKNITEEQKKQIENFAKFVLKDNKKEDENNYTKH